MLELSADGDAGATQQTLIAMALTLSLIIGIVAGLRTVTPPAAVSWAARLGWLNLSQTPLAFLGYAFTPWILTVLALGQLVNDKLPTTPSRKLPAPFAARIISGALAAPPSARPARRSSSGDSRASLAP